MNVGSKWIASQERPDHLYAGQPANGVDEIRNLIGLFDKVVTGVDDETGLFAVVLSGDGKDLDVRQSWIRFDEPARFDTIHDRHVQIHENDIRLVALGYLHRLEAIAGLENGVVILQRVGEHAANTLNIVDDQYLGHETLSVRMVPASPDATRQQIKR